MGLPGFSAETSLYKTIGRYRAMGENGPATGTVYPTITPTEFLTSSLDFAVSIFRPISKPIFVDAPGHFFRVCGGLGQSCCRAPAASQNIPAFGPLVGCQKGLGCDITTNKCVANCGNPGQVCCDGPETRAPKWTADGKVYSPNSWNMQEMCSQGSCDRQSHRCFICGMQDGSRCCPPDAAQATARCFGANLSCEFDPWGFFTSGTCRACGKQGRAPCDWGCEPGLGIRNGLCDACGGNLQLPCDKGCNPGLGMLQGLCRQCGNSGQIPCDSGCGGGLNPRNGLCAVCGGSGQPPCDSGCNPGTVLRNGLCTYCGNNGQVPCDNGCIPPTKLAGGVCQYCGANGQVPCDGSGCNPGLSVSGGLCRQPTPQPDTCAKLGETCVADFVNGMHCCKSGSPLLCVQAKCKECVKHGEECKAFGPQTCCSAVDGDVCVLDQFTGKAVCGIPG